MRWWLALITLLLAATIPARSALAETPPSTIRPSQDVWPAGTVVVCLLGEYSAGAFIPGISQATLERVRESLSRLSGREQRIVVIDSSGKVSTFQVQHGTDYAQGSETNCYH